MAGGRQIVETAFARLRDRFGFTRDRPHACSGFCAHLAAKVARYDFYCWLNQGHGRPLLTFADLLDWSRDGHFHTKRFNRRPRGLQRTTPTASIMHYAL